MKISESKAFPSLGFGDGSQETSLNCSEAHVNVLLNSFKPSSPSPETPRNLLEIHTLKPSWHGYSIWKLLRKCFPFFLEHPFGNSSPLVVPLKISLEVTSTIRFFSTTSLKIVCIFFLGNLFTNSQIC